MPIKINMTGVNVDEFAPLPKDLYHVRVTGCEAKRSSDKGNPYLEWKFVVTEGEYENRKVWHNTSLLPQSLWSLKRLLLALGFDADDLAGEVDLEEDQVIDLECAVQIDHRMYNGQARQQVVAIFASDYEPADAAETELTGDDLPFE